MCALWLFIVRLGCSLCDGWRVVNWRMAGLGERRSFSWMVLLTALAVFAGPPASVGSGSAGIAGVGFAGVGIAHADDDDDDDGGGGGNGSGSGGSGYSERSSSRSLREAPLVKRWKRSVRRNAPRVRRAARIRATPVQAATLPDFARGEIVVTNLNEADLARLVADGFELLERVDLVEVATVLYRLGVPARLSLEEARSLVRAQPSGATGDFNHYYRHEEQAPTGGADDPDLPLPVEEVAPCTHLNCPALDLIGWPGKRAGQCRVDVPIGIIDTNVNEAHENLAGARIEVLRLSAERGDPSQSVHGTAVTSLLVGQVPDRAPGLVPEAGVIVVDVFSRDEGDERASVVSLLKALDLLSRRDVPVINMSLAGPPNAALEAALSALARPGGALVLAAAGNGGPRAGVAYPAGYATVLAITAVDQRGQVYRRAQRGAHVDLAAPGVEVWSATSVKGVRPRTGTSFAVPFVTAAAALLVSRDPGILPETVAAQLRLLVRDLGAPGQDDVFGAGLLSLGSLCGGEKIAPPLE